MPSRLESELRAVEQAEREHVGPPLRAVALLAAALGDLDERAVDALARRRRRVAARRIAALACEAAATLQGAFGDRPDDEQARARVAAALRSRAASPAAAPATIVRALAEVAELALALPQVPEGEDWQLGAIAFVDEAALRELCDGCLALAAVAVREAARS